MHIGIDREKKEETEIYQICFYFLLSKSSNSACSFSWILRLYLIRLLNWNLISLTSMSANNRADELWEPNSLWINERTSSVYPVSFGFDFLTVTLFTTLRISMREKIVSGVSHNSRENIVTYVKRKTWSKGKANFIKGERLSRWEADGSY